jgi:hypothetical protein
MCLMHACMHVCMYAFEQQLAVQSEQIRSTHSDVDAINEGMNRATKQVPVCQKRPILVSKEAYTSVKRGLG